MPSISEVHVDMSTPPYKEVDMALNRTLAMIVFHYYGQHIPWDALGHWCGGVATQYQYLRVH